MRKIDHILSKIFNSRLTITEFSVIQFFVFPKWKTKFSIFLGLWERILSFSQNNDMKVKKSALAATGWKLCFFGEVLSEKKYTKSKKKSHLLLFNNAFR